MNTNVIIMKLALTLLALPPFFPQTLPSSFSWICLQPWARPHTLHLNPAHHPPTFDLPCSRPHPFPAHLCMRHRALLHCFYYSIRSLLDQPLDPAPSLMSSRQCDAPDRLVPGCKGDVWLYENGCRCRKRV